MYANCTSAAVSSVSTHYNKPINVQPSRTLANITNHFIFHLLLYVSQRAACVYEEVLQGAYKRNGHLKDQMESPF